MKILVVDDQPFERMVIQDCLEKAGYTDLYKAVSGEQALEILGIEDDGSVKTRSDV